MIDFFKKKPYILLLIVVILLVILIASARGQDELSATSDIAGTIVTPVASTTTSAISKVGNFFANLFGISDAQKENQQLKYQILQMQSDINLLTELQKENERLREATNFVSSDDDYEKITVRVVSENPSHWFDTMVVNAGRNKGIAKDMPVVDIYGNLVGRITEVGQNWSRILTIIDGNSNVSGIIERTRHNGIIKGVVELGSANDLCQMSLLPLDSDLVPTDKVLTSGLGGVFPKGILIGEVSEVGKTAEGEEKTISIKPAADFSRLEEVIIILNIFEELG